MNLLKKAHHGNWESSVDEVGQQIWNLVTDALAGNESVQFPFKWLPELGDDDKLLQAMDVVAKFRSIDQQIMANRQKLKKHFEEEDVSTESERLQSEMDEEEQRLNFLLEADRGLVNEPLTEHGGDNHTRSIISQKGYQ